jgi:hypothetical protein
MLKGVKEIVNVSNEPYCKDCGKKAFLNKNKKPTSTLSNSNSASLNKKIIPLSVVEEEETVVLAVCYSLFLLIFLHLLHFFFLFFLTYRSLWNLKRVLYPYGDKS